EAMADMLNDSDFGESYIQLMDWPNSSTVGDFSNEEPEFDTYCWLKQKSMNDLSRLGKAN
ncbi:MAG: hypothetical protein LBQ23_01715, partial [Puniceicoccales bacterium]|nr:hypothetical protein [Puniceicoccales bacterium]